MEDRKEGREDRVEMLIRMTSDVTAAHEQVKFTVVKFPSFNKDLGPSLDNLHDKKDMKKSKEKADQAVKQYEKDIEGLRKSRAAVKVPKSAKTATTPVKSDKIDLKTVLLAVDKDLDALQKVLGDIKTALTKVTVPK